MCGRDRVFAEAGRGLCGDRYHAGTGTFSRRALSILDAETLELCRRRLGWPIEASSLRRNLLIDSASLYDLKGRTLAIGATRIVLAGRCPPCGYLSRLLNTDMRCALHGLGGMRAAIETGGMLQIGDPVHLLDGIGLGRLPA